MQGWFVKLEAENNRRSWNLNKKVAMNIYHDDLFVCYLIANRAKTVYRNLIFWNPNSGSASS